MPQYTYYLDPEQHKKLTITRKLTWKDLSLFYNDEPVGAIETKEQLQQGQTFTLPDQSILSLKLKTGFADELEVLHNGEPLTGSATDISQKVKNAWQLTFFLGALNIILGLLGKIFDVQLLESIGTGMASLVLGPVYLALSFGIKRLWAGALYGAMVAVVLDIALTFYLKYTGVSDVSPGSGFILKAFFLYTLAKAVTPFNQLKEQQA